MAMLFLAPQLLGFSPSTNGAVTARVLRRSSAPLATYNEPPAAVDELMSVVNVAGGEAAAAAAALREILGEAEEPLFEVEDEVLVDNGDDKLTVPQLKELLKAKKLPVSGKKAELVARLASAAATSAIVDADADAAPDAGAAADALVKGKDDDVIANSAVDPRMVALLSAKGIVKFTPIQIQSFDLLRSGADMLGRSQTGIAAGSKRTGHRGTERPATGRDRGTGRATACPRVLEPAASQVTEPTCLLALQARARRSRLRCR